MSSSSRLRGVALPLRRATVAVPLPVRVAPAAARALPLPVRRRALLLRVLVFRELVFLRDPVALRELALRFRAALVFRDALLLRDPLLVLREPALALRLPLLFRVPPRLLLREPPARLAALLFREPPRPLRELSPASDRSWFTVRAAVSSERLLVTPLSAGLICSSCRARLLPALTPRGGIRLLPRAHPARAGSTEAISTPRRASP